MILSFTAIFILNLVYSSIGKEIKQPLLVSYKDNCNEIFRQSIVAFLRKDEKQALNYAYIVFFMIGLSAYLLNLLVSKHPSAKNFGHPWEYEALVFVLPLLFGFKQNSEVKENSLVIINKILRFVNVIIIPICILLAIVRLVYPPFKEISYSNILETSSYVILALALLAIIMFAIYIFIPHFSSKLVVRTLKWIFFRLLKYDRKDPITGLFRHFSYLAAFFGLFQFILSWLFQNPFTS